MRKAIPPHPEAIKALEHIIYLAGNRMRLGLALGLSKKAVHLWTVVPEGRVKAICKLYGLKPKQVRPDLSDFVLKILML